jgi:hypothetical protein
MKKQTIELPEALEDWYTSQFPTNRQGIKQAVSSYYENLNDHPMAGMFQDHDTAHYFMLQAWKQMWRHSLASLKGVFSKGELSLFIDTHNGMMLSPWHYGSNTLAAGTSDAIALDNMADKWSVDPQVILEKIHSLTPTQALCLEVWATGFWQGQNARPESDGKDEFAAYIDLLA